MQNQVVPAQSAQHLAQPLQRVVQTTPTGCVDVQPVTVGISEYGHPHGALSFRDQRKLDSMSSSPRGATSTRIDRQWREILRGRS
jgi:hypothetical protein